jgi:hypothetical protein
MLQPPKSVTAKEYAILERVGQRRRNGASQLMLARCSDTDSRSLPMRALELDGHMYARVE